MLPRDIYELRCSTPQQDNELLNFNCKLVLNGTGYDDREDFERLTHAGRHARRKRKALQDLNDEYKERSEELREFTKIFMT